MDRAARNRRYYEKHRDDLLRKKREKRANPEYRQRESQRRQDWYRRNAEPFKVGRALEIKIAEARQIIGANHVSNMVRPPAGP